MLRAKAIYGFVTESGEAGCHIWNDDWCMAVLYVDEQDDAELYIKLELDANSYKSEAAREFHGVGVDRHGDTYFPLGTFTPTFDEDGTPDWKEVEEWASMLFGAYEYIGEIVYEE